MDDIDLMARLKGGDTGAMAALFDKYYPLCLYCAGNLLASREDAEDAAIEAFAALWESRHVYDPGQCRPKTWLLLFVRRKAVDILRRRTGHLPLDDDRLILFTVDEYRLADTRAAVMAVVKRMSNREQDVFYRRFFYGESHGEIARQLGTSTGAVKTMVSRLRKTIREAIDYEDGGLYG